MADDELKLASFADLQCHVRDVLCARDRLAPAEAQLRQAWVTRSGQRCGLFFQVNGPRLLRTYAVWVRTERRILFYESTGHRFAETRLQAEPEIGN